MTRNNNNNNNNSDRNDRHNTNNSLRKSAGMDGSKKRGGQQARGTGRLFAVGAASRRGRTAK